MDPSEKEETHGAANKVVGLGKTFLGFKDAGRTAVLGVLRHRYVREKQQAMRYRQHAERMHYPQFRDGLFSLAAVEEKHAESIAAKIKDLGEKPPDVIPIHVAQEQNSWLYLRTDREEEQRCAGELQDDLPAITGEFPWPSFSSALTVTAKGIGLKFATCWRAVIHSRPVRLESLRKALPSA